MGIKYDGVGAPNAGNKKPPVKKAAPRKTVSADTAERTAVYAPWQKQEQAAGAPSSYDEWLNQTAGAGQWRAQNPTTPALPVPLVQSSGGGGGGGGSSDPHNWAGIAAQQNALQTMFQGYNTPGSAAPVDDGVLAGKLAQFTKEAQATGDAAGAQLAALLGGQQNAYKNNTFQSAQVGANPMAAYMAASGADTTQVEALRAMLQGSNNAGAQADQMMNDRASQSWEMQQAGRTADAATNTAAFNQSLAATGQGMQSQVAKQFADQQTAWADKEAARKSEMQMEIIKFAAENGLDLAAMGITFPGATPAPAVAAPAPPVPVAVAAPAAPAPAPPSRTPQRSVNPLPAATTGVRR